VSDCRSQTSRIAAFEGKCTSQVFTITFCGLFYSDEENYTPRCLWLCISPYVVTAIKTRPLRLTEHWTSTWERRDEIDTLPESDWNCIWVLKWSCLICRVTFYSVLTINGWRQSQAMDFFYFERRVLGSYSLTDSHTIGGKKARSMKRSPKQRGVL
jgi:hypothetical protein